MGRSQVGPGVAGKTLLRLSLVSDKRIFPRVYGSFSIWAYTRIGRARYDRISSCVHMNRESFDCFDASIATFFCLRYDLKRASARVRLRTKRDSNNKLKYARSSYKTLVWNSSDPHASRINGKFRSKVGAIFRFGQDSVRVAEPAEWAYMKLTNSSEVLTYCVQSPVSILLIDL